MQDDDVARIGASRSVVLGLHVGDARRRNRQIRAALAIGDRFGVLVVDERRIKIVLAGGAETGSVSDDVVASDAGEVRCVAGDRAELVVEIIVARPGGGDPKCCSNRPRECRSHCNCSHC